MASLSYVCNVVGPHVYSGLSAVDLKMARSAHRALASPLSLDALLRTLGLFGLECTRQDSFEDLLRKNPSADDVLNVLYIEARRRNASINDVLTVPHGQAAKAPLYFAVKLRCHIAVKMFLGLRAPVNQGSQNDWTPLLLASWIGDAKSVALLLAEGAHVNHVCTSSGWTALAAAVVKDSDEVCSQLIEAGADICLAVEKLKAAESCCYTQVLTKLSGMANSMEELRAMEQFRNVS